MSPGDVVTVTWRLPTTGVERTRTMVVRAASKSRVTLGPRNGQGGDVVVPVGRIVSAVVVKAKGQATDDRREAVALLRTVAREGGDASSLLFGAANHLSQRRVSRARVYLGAALETTPGLERNKRVARAVRLWPALRAEPGEDGRVDG